MSDKLMGWMSEAQRMETDRKFSGNQKQKQPLGITRKWLFLYRIW